MDTQPTATVITVEDRVEALALIVERLVDIARAPSGQTPSDLLNLEEDVLVEAFGDKS